VRFSWETSSAASAPASDVASVALVYDLVRRRVGRVAAGRIRWVLANQGRTGAGGLPGDTRTGSRTAMAAVAKACRGVTLASSSTANRTGGAGAITLYDCQGRAAGLMGVAVSQGRP
jgi:hypothetical protein